MCPGPNQLGSLRTRAGSSFFKGRSSKRRKVVSLPSRTVVQGGATPPEAILELQAPIDESLLPGAVVGADGGPAIRACVRSTSRKRSGSATGIPVAAAIHGKQPVKQFTRLVKMPKDEIPDELKRVLDSQGRMSEWSTSVRFTGGNQAAESEWGTSGQLLSQKAAHRGKATLHSTAHGCSALFLSTCPGLRIWE